MVLTSVAKLDRWLRDPSKRDQWIAAWESNPILSEGFDIVFALALQSSGPDNIEKNALENARRNGVLSVQLLIEKLSATELLPPVSPLPPEWSYGEAGPEPSTEN